MNSTRKIAQVIATSIAVLAMLLSSVHVQPAYAGGYMESASQMGAFGSKIAERSTTIYENMGHFEQALLAPTGTVTLWHAYTGGSGDETALNQVIQNAEAAYPGLNIITEFHDFGSLLNDYRSAVDLGGGPDLYILPNDDIGNQARDGYILNIDSYLQGQLTNVQQAAIDAMTVNGELYGVPESNKAVALYYNKTLVPTPPTTTDELLALLEGGKKLAVPGNGSYYLYGFWNAFGGQLMDADAHCIADQGGFVPAMQYLKSLKNKGASFEMDYNVAWDQFTAGQVGMYINGPWALNDLKAALGEDLGVALLPNGPTADAKPLSGPDGFYVNPHTADAANTVEVALYLTNQASSQIFTDVAGHIPARSDVTSADPLINTFAQSAAQGEPRPQNHEFNNYWPYFGDMFTNVLVNGSETPTVGVENACAKMNASNMYIQVRANEDRIEVVGWPAGITVNLAINNPNTDNNPDFVDSQTVDGLTPWGSGETFTQFELGGRFDIKQGFVVSVDDGVVTKSHTVKSLQFTDIDPITDKVTGKAANNSQVEIWACNDGPCVNRHVTANGSGVWVAKFGEVGTEPDEQETLDLRASTWVDSSQWDNDSDSTMFGMNIANPHFGVRANTDELELYEWPKGKTVSIQIDDPGIGENPDYATTVVIGTAPWDPNQTYAYLPVSGEFDVEPGHVVIVSDSTTTKTHTVSSLQFTNFDVPNDVVTGTATANTRVDVWACGNTGTCINRHIDSDGSGNWLADFLNLGDEEDEQESFNITYGTWVDSSEYDPDSDFTQYGLNIPNTRVEAIINENVVEGYEWPEGASITLEIDDPDTGDPIDYTDSQTASYPEWDPHNTYLRFDLTSFELKVGHTVKLTDGEIVKQLVVTDVQVTGWDYEADTIIGIAPPNVELWVYHWTDEWSPRHIQSDENGNWVADYGVEGDEDFEQFTRDIVNGSTGDVSVSDEDSDATRFVWDTYSIWVAPSNIPFVSALARDTDLNRPGYGADEWTVLNLLYEPLFRQGTNGTLIPAAATGYTVSPNGLVYTIKLRANKWSDGQAVTAQHYVDGFLHILNPNTATDYAYLLFDIQGAQSYNEGLFANPKSVKIMAVDNTTLQITLTEKTAYFPKLLTMPGFFPVRLDRISANGNSWTQPGKLVSNGAYKLKEHDAGHFLLVKNPNYYNVAKVSLDQIGLAIYRESATVTPFEAYQNGDVDVITAPNETLTDPLYRFERVYSDQPGVFFIGLNVQRGPTNNTLVRQALAAATDRNALLEALGMPWREAATGVIPPELPGYQGTDAGFPFNPTLAQDLLEQAGYPGGAGLPTIHLYASDTPVNHLMFDTLAAQWSTVLGIDVQSHYPADYGEWVSGCESNPGDCEYNGIRIGWFVDYFDAHSVLNDLFHPDNFSAKRLGWDNTEYRTLIDQSRATLNVATRTSLLKQAETILVEEDAAVIPLYFTDRVDLVKPGFKTAYGVVPYYEQWSFKPVTAPAAFSKTSPVINALKVAANPTISWAASTFAAEYEYCIDTIDNNTCDTEWIITATTNASLSGLLNDTSYYWQVRANNALGTTEANTSAWWTFRVVISAPLLVSPANGENVLTQKPTFDWNDVAEAGASGYTIQVSASNTFAKGTHTANTTESTYTPVTDLPKGKLYWRVRSTGTNGPSAWSEVRSYQGPNPPAAPVLKLPANNSLAKIYTPTFKWSAVVIPANAAPFERYELQVATDVAFTSIILDEDIAGLSNTQFTPVAEFDSNTKYYWRVRSVSTLPENGAWSAIWSFRTVLTPPELDSPANGAPMVELRPLFDWNAPGGPGSITGYTIQFSKNIEFTQIVHTGNPVNSEYIPTANLPKNMPVYWRVLAKGANGPSAYSDIWSVVMPVNPPPTPVLLSPASNAILREYNNPTLKWKPITDASFQNYHVQLADNTAFANPIVNEDNLTNRLTTELVTSVSLTPSTRYYWRVRAVNTSGELGNWSTVWTIRAAIPAPLLISPDSGATGVSRTPWLDWSDVDGNTGYVLQIWKGGTLVKTVNLLPNISEYQVSTNLLPNTNYTWKVKTKSSVAPSTWSEFNFKTGP